jgi:hypothetical protein
MKRVAESMVRQEIIEAGYLYVALAACVVSQSKPGLHFGRGPGLRYGE